MTVRHSNT